MQVKALAAVPGRDGIEAAALIGHVELLVRAAAIRPEVHIHSLAGGDARDIHALAQIGSRGDAIGAVGDGLRAVHGHELPFLRLRAVADPALNIRAVGGVAAVDVEIQTGLIDDVK